jgi:hypothetical protein
MIPRAFADSRLAASSQGQALRSLFERIAHSNLDLPEETIRQFGISMNTGDPLGDTYIDLAFASREGKSRARKDVERALKDGIESVADPSPELLALFGQINTDPEWVDWDMVEHGAEVFRRYGKELYPYFGMISSVGYGNRTISRPLALTGAYTGNSAFSRYLETGVSHNHLHQRFGSKANLWRAVIDWLSARCRRT